MITEKNPLQDLAATVEYMSQFVLPDRLERILQVSAERTRYITMILEDIHYAQNASAVVRSCDCFGIQDLHFIFNNPPEGQKKIRKHVAQGAEKWVDIHRHLIQKNIGTEKTTEKILSKVRNKGYRIIATIPGRNAVPLNELNIESGKIALVMGNEQRGITETVRKMADETVTIPMHGFSESFNVSVSAAIILNNLVTRLKTLDIDWQLTTAELDMLRLKWLKLTIPKAKEILEQYNMIEQ